MFIQQSKEDLGLFSINFSSFDRTLRFYKISHVKRAERYELMSGEKITKEASTRRAEEIEQKVQQFFNFRKEKEDAIRGSNSASNSTSDTRVLEWLGITTEEQDSCGKHGVSSTGSTTGRGWVAMYDGCGCPDQTPYSCEGCGRDLQLGWRSNNPKPFLQKCILPIQASTAQRSCRVAVQGAKEKSCSGAKNKVQLARRLQSIALL
ncbi:hypothetical protein HUJ04_007652 [Dendroctonus ponderosae]|nr:hypothetical protein HUJ04_007652 [Dendroctonus ponderosae]KAH1025731.1 hypothetical protein HUJ05_010401 [Dendroctonus ponderosae]